MNDSGLYLLTKPSSMSRIQPAVLRKCSGLPDKVEPYTYVAQITGVPMRDTTASPGYL